MNTVGRIGSYIGRGVRSVSGTLNPFGGAVDIIVVKQPDGSLKSSPWYVRFGKFQEVLKAKEKVVNVSVNGVEAGFCMNLDSRGQAYFLRELDMVDGDSLTTRTSEQLATLNLKEGKNVVVFTCSKQQVDACIYLWRWDTNIVVSDVDGTITRRTAINCFSKVHVLFHRPISLDNSCLILCRMERDYQKDLFLHRLMDFFVLYFEKDVKALFPSDRNPFYAGFGNRDTDKLSYLKVGIPEGKIFTIDPKGQIVMNHHIDTKSYTYIHGCVDGMFPPLSSREQICYGQSVITKRRFFRR